MEIFIPGLGTQLRTAAHKKACPNKRLRPWFHGHGVSRPIKIKWFVPTKADRLF